MPRRARIAVPNRLISPHHESDRLGHSESERRAAYRQLLTAHIDPPYP